MPIQKPITVTTPLGEEDLLFRRMRGTEGLGRPFEFELELLSPQYDLELSSVLGQDMTVHLPLREDTRHFHGHVASFALIGGRGRYAVYWALLRPWIWLLSWNSECRIFQEMTVPDIIKQVFRDRGHSDFEEALSGSYRTRDYVVQYRESDFNFVSRLMEQEGIYYYFRHEKGKHTLVLSDSYSAHEPCAGAAEVPYFPPDERAQREQDYLDAWAVTQRMQSGIHTLTDYDFERPKADLLVTRKSQQEQPGADSEVYDYPGEYVESSDGEHYVRMGLERFDCGVEQAEGGGTCRGLMAGGLFTLEGFPHEAQNREYLITSAGYDLETDEYESVGDSSQGPTYRCTIEAMDSKSPYRPPAVTPKPVVQGPHTAVVVGKSGEEIWTDKYGRVKVQFHWDREGKADENSSCWVRVAQIWAGSRWGGIHIPRIGHEVVVEFLEGDPDRPLITGSVYNADNMPPYDLPANQTQSGIKSRSSKDGKADNFNEIRFEDKKGEELLYEQAEKDRELKVKNDERHWVGNDRSKEVVNNEDTLIGGSRSEVVKKNETVSVEGKRTESVAKDESVDISGRHSHSVGKDETRSVTGNRTRDVGKDESVSIGKSETVNVGKNATLEIADNRTVNIGKNDTLDVGKKLAITAADQITIKTGDASITMKKNGSIVIKGKDITLKGSGKINVKASGDVIIKGSKVAAN